VDVSAEAANLRGKIAMYRLIGAVAFVLVISFGIYSRSARGANATGRAFYSAAQAKRGKAVYDQNCSKCHLQNLQGSCPGENVRVSSPYVCASEGSTPPLVGDAFARPLLDHLQTRSYDLSSLFVIGSGGAILSPHFKQALLEHVPHAIVVDGFGASETGANGASPATPPAGGPTATPAANTTTQAAPLSVNSAIAR
jgi:hypothetical protein